MVRIKAFYGIRPQKELASRIASPPYDVVDSAEARELVKNNPYSFLHVVKSEVDLPDTTDLYDPAVYRKAADNMVKFRTNWMLQDDTPCMYIYRQSMDGRSQTGLLAVQHIDDYLEGKVRIHELTREDKEKDRITHIDTVNANTGPVFFTYPRDIVIDTLVAQSITGEPDYDYMTKENVRHTLWVLSDPDAISRLTKAFSLIDQVYVADGHHRSKASAMVGKSRRESNPHHTGNEEYNWFLSVLFPANQLKIIDYNRVVKDLNGLSPEEFLGSIRHDFTVKEVPDALSARPAAEHDMALYLEHRWYRLTLHPEHYAHARPVEKVDSALLTKHILSPILGIENLRKDKRIDFIGGSRGLEELQRLVDSGEMAAAFALFPITVRQLMEIADADELMPPKTTWFEPKLQSGLVVHSLEDKS
ncbi:MAG: DUF1015 domain-containing protein [Candidatus Marinimicrobia bacterium]|nr:DUF1015 domain-containing protein [Candidatus Neomarinimicrobiota bacterium]